MVSTCVLWSLPINLFASLTIYMWWSAIWARAKPKLFIYGIVNYVMYSWIQINCVYEVEIPHAVICTFVFIFFFYLLVEETYLWGDACCCILLNKHVKCLYLTWLVVTLWTGVHWPNCQKKKMTVQGMLVYKELLFNLWKYVEIISCHYGYKYM